MTWNLPLSSLTEPSTLRTGQDKRHRPWKWTGLTHTHKDMGTHKRACARTHTHGTQVAAAAGLQDSCGEGRKSGKERECWNLRFLVQGQKKMTFAVVHLCQSAIDFSLLDSPYCPINMKVIKCQPVYPHTLSLTHIHTSPPLLVQ